MLDLPQCFAADYAQARAAFLAAARRRALPVESFVHPTARGAHGELLASDVAIIGEPASVAWLLLTSAVHGVEGFCGSGIQVALLRDDAAYRSLAADGVAIALYHGVNPYGFSHLRRTNEDNVDVNRNFRDFTALPARNDVYAAMHDLLVPATWPPSPENRAAVGARLAGPGFARLQAAISDGQADRADGLFYTGREPVWSNVTLREFLGRAARACSRLAWIDFHSGLGGWGTCEKIYSGPDEPRAIARAKRWYGADVTAVHDGTSTSAATSGVAYHAALDACPQAAFTGLTLEAGTRPVGDVLQALRADQWLANHPDDGEPLRAPIQAAMRDAFYDDSVAWQAMIYGQARVTVLQAVRALRVPEPGCAVEVFNQRR